MVKAQQIADQFILIINEWLTKGELAKVNRRNKINDPHVCATHDFCDANMAMHEAFMSFGIDPLSSEHGPMSDEMVYLWNTAWGIAKNQKFMRTVY